MVKLHTLPIGCQISEKVKEACAISHKGIKNVEKLRYIVEHYQGTSNNTNTILKRCFYYQVIA